MKPIRCFWAKLLFTVLLLVALLPLISGYSGGKSNYYQAGGGQAAYGERKIHSFGAANNGAYDDQTEVNRPAPVDDFPDDPDVPERRSNGRTYGRGYQFNNQHGRQPFSSAQQYGSRGCPNCKRNRHPMARILAKSHQGTFDGEQTGEGYYSPYPHACCDLKIVQLYFKAVNVSRNAARAKRSLFMHEFEEGDPAFCCDPRIMSVIQSAVNRELNRPPKELVLYKDPSPLNMVFFQAQGIEKGHPSKPDQFELIRFKRLDKNIGEGFNFSKMVFRAPVDGLYRFHLRLHNNDTDKESGAKACIALAPFPEIEKRTAEYCFLPSSTGSFSATRPLKSGEQMAALSMGPVDSQSWGAVNDGSGLRFAEFSGSLLRSM